MLSKMRRALRTTLSSAVAVGAFCVASGAHANPAFPTLLQQLVPMPCLPDCTLCHNTTAGGPGNIRPHSMGTTWPMYGLDGNKFDSLGPALMQAKAAMQDTDMDGIPDVDELSMGLDPDNAALGARACEIGAAAPKPVVYGCARVAPQGQVDNVAAAASALVALVGVAALRRRTARRAR